MLTVTHEGYQGNLYLIKQVGEKAVILLSDHQNRTPDFHH